MTDEALEAPTESGQAEETQQETLARMLDQHTIEEEPTEEVTDEQVDDDDEVEEEEEQEDGTTQTQDEETEEEVEEEDFSMDAPKDWSKKEQEEFNGLPDESKAIVKKRYEDMLSDYRKKTEAISGVKKDQELWNMIFDEDTRGNLKQTGVNPQQYVTSLMEWDRSANSDPAGTIKAMMTHLNVSAKDLGLITKGESSDEDFDFDNDVEVETKPETTSIKPVRNTIDLERQVLEFQYAEDEKGKRLHPHFNDETMGEMQVLFATKRAKTLDEAYKLSPTVKELENLSKEKGAKVNLSTTRKKTAKAKKAASSVTNRTSNSTTTDHSDMSQREVLEAKLRQASG